MVLDVFTRAIRGWELARHLTEELSKAALERALQNHRPEIHHSEEARAVRSDRLYPAAGSRRSSDQHGSRGQTDRKCLCGALDADTSREEEVYLHEYRDLEDARQHLGRFLDEVYMHKRVHSALGYVPPAEYEAQWYAEQAAAPQTSRSAVNEFSAAEFGDSQSATALAQVSARMAGNPP